MELQLRPPVRRYHPLMRPRRGFEGLGQNPGVNTTTIFIPGTGPGSGFLSTPGNPATASGGPAVFQAPTLIPPPACSQDTQPGGAAFSAACIAQVLANQQQNFQLQNNANFQVDYSNCVGQGIDPGVCASRTYGLTPAGGFTSDAHVQGGGGQTIVDANGNPVLAPPPVYTGGPLPGMTTSPAGGPPGGSAPSLSFTNLTTGDNHNFKVGDRWQITINGAAPNQPVNVTGGQNGANTRSQMGTTDSSGNFSLNGQMDQSQIGTWSETWTVATTPAGTFNFVVSPSGSTGSAPATSKTSASTPSIFGTLPGGSIDIGGTSVPWLAIGAGVVVLVLMMRK